MLKRKKEFLLCFYLGIGLLVCGCGSTKRIESTAIPSKPMSNEVTPGQKASQLTSGNYVVLKHDCLWKIAGLPGIYGDSFQWPILFKTNRDEIKDPDLIYPRQDLRVENGYSIEEKNNARQMAMATPKYVPHIKPRETLPVDYF
ncbi:MAG TPA: hypothetical protein VIJ93_12835 [bacterium]